MLRRYLLLCVAITLAFLSISLAQNPVDVQPGRVVMLDIDAVSQQFAAAPWRAGELNEQARSGQPAQVTLPTPEGATATFVFERVATMAPDLQARYPDIRSYAGHAVGDPTRTLRADFSSQLGWSFMFGGKGERAVLQAQAAFAKTSDGTMLPAVVSGKAVAYRLMLASEAPAPNHTCSTGDEQISGKPLGNLRDYGFGESPPTHDLNPGKATEANRAGDCRLRRYRLSLTCTGEYAVAVAGTNPTVAGVLAEMNRGVNRLNQLYENDLGVSFQLVANNDQVVFLNGASDPYTNNNPDAMLGQSQTTIDARIGSANYDIGHIFATEGAGLAAGGVVCRANSKARGTTGIGNPTGDGFYIDYVAHEMGHQFGASHTFYNSCGGNRASSTSFESGSGATIMAYAGICSPNVAPRSFDYFHAASLAQIHDYMANGGNCAQIGPINNQPPVLVGANTLKEYFIPVSTRFELILSATDADGDTLTHVWEQFDGGGTDPQPPLSTNTQGPSFQPVYPSASPRRRFPSAPGLAFEVLPSVARELNFRGTVRDNHRPYGCTAERDVRLRTVVSLPFVITNNNLVATLGGFATVPLTWEIGSTTLSPISTPLVDVFFSRDGGETYTDTLGLGLANNGSTSVTIPNVATQRGRFVVKGHNNVFFDISDADLTVTPTTAPTFFLGATPALVSVCRGASSRIDVSLSSVLGFTAPVSLSLSPTPVGITASLVTTSGQGNFTVGLDIVTTAQAAKGSYLITLTATGGGVTRELKIPLIVGEAPRVASLPTAPADGADEGLVLTTFRFAYNVAEGPIRLQVSTDATFATGVLEDLFTRGDVSVTGLTAGVYYWRVAYENECGRGPWSALRSFRRLRTLEVPYSNNVRVPIGTGAAGSYTSVINSPRTGQIYQVEVVTDLQHTYIGDINGFLTMPLASRQPLFNRPGGGGCDGENLIVTFADDAIRTATDFVGACGSSSPSISGEYRPVAPFFAQLPREGRGDYTLTIADNAAADGGAIKSWSLRLWYLDQPQVNASFTSDTLRLRQNSSAVVLTANLGATATGVAAGQTRYVLKTLPTLGQLRLNGVALVLGASFTQADIDAGRISYVSTSTAGLDRATLDVQLQPFGFNPNRQLLIRITLDDLAVTATASTAVTCAGTATGAITAMATGGVAPYQFSLGTGAFQMNNVFTGLVAGTYTVRVRGADGVERTAASVTLVDPAVLTLSVSSTGNSLSATGLGGTGVLSYSLNGTNFQSSAIFSGLADGSYTVTVRDANGCTARAQAVINTVRLTVTAAVTMPIRCAGQTGTIQAAAAGGPAPFAYRINGGTPQASSTFSGLAAGTYTVTVTDNAGGTATANTVTLQAPPALLLSSTVNQRDISVTAQGGTAPYTYSIDGFTFVGGTTFAGLANGDYTLTVRDANGCTATSTARVRVNDLVIIINQTATVSCAGGTDAAINAVVTGGRAPYSYSLNGGTPQSSPLFPGIGAGNYTVTVTDADGLTQTSMSLVITAPAPLSATAIVLGSDISVSASGGTSPYTYSLNAATPQNSGVFTGLAAGTYTITVRDARGCSTTASGTIVAEALALRVDLRTATETCPGAADGAVTLTGVNGVPPYAYSLDGVTYVATTQFSALAAGNYTGYVRDAAATVATTTFVIGAQPVPTAVVEVNGSFIEVTSFTGAVTGLAYSFNGGETFSNEPFGYRYAAGPVEVVIRYGNCTFRTSAVITDPLEVTTTDLVVCPGDTTSRVEICVKGGTAAYSIVTSAGIPVGVSSATCPGGFVVPAPAASGTYTVMVTDQTGAQRTVSFQVVIVPTFTVAVSTDINALIVTVTGGAAPFTYSIDGGVTTQTTGRFENLVPGSYTITVVDRYGCTQTVTSLVSSVNAIAEAIGLRLYPNPARGEVHVQVDRPDQVRSITVYTVTGQLVARYGSLAASGTVELTGVVPGFYVVEVDHAEGRAHVPLVVE